MINDQIAILGTTQTMSPNRGAPALMAAYLVKRFGGVAAVDGVSIEVAPGEIVGLVGPNGAGKTTLFDLVAGEQRPTSGSIALNGVAVERAAPDARLAQGLARTFQIPRPFPGMTLLENVMLGGQNQSGERVWPNWFAQRRVAREERACRDKAMALLRFVELERLALDPARVLSGGQRKLLELARAMMTEPSLLLLDEPAAGVNPSLMNTIVERVVEINRRGVAVLVIEHNMDVIVRLCRRVYVMAAGRMLTEGPPAAVIGDPRVIEAYLGGAAA
jgi:branched-chain amino acid transport system ATP-binding protein